MKAIVYNKNNAPALLSLRDVEKPIPQENQVLVKVHAVSLNAADYRSMSMGIIPKGKIFGADIAGVVEATGPNTQRFKVGDAVFGDLSASSFGGLAEYVAAPERLLAFKPKEVSFDQAAAVPMAALTALQGLRDVGKLQPGMKVLIYGAGGGVGLFAVQLARHFGAQVTAVCGPHNAELVCALGAERVVDYTQTDITQSGETFDLILGVNGSRPLRDYRRMLAPRGSFVLVGGGLPQLIKTMLLGPVLSLGDRKMRLLAAKPNAADLETVIELVAAGKVKPIIDRIFPFEQTPAAFDYLRQGHARGKVVINGMVPISQK